MYVFKFWNKKLPNLSNYIILGYIFNINTINRLFNCSVFNFRVESFCIHTRFSSTTYLYNCMCIFLYVYIYYIPTYFSFLRCRICIYILFFLSTVFLTICYWRTVLLRPLWRDLSTNNYGLSNKNTVQKNDTSNSNTTPLGPKIKITRTVLFTEYIRQSISIYCWNSLFLDDLIS